MKLGRFRLFELRRTIGPENDPLLYRWVLLRTPWFGVYIHKLLRSDYERALHDHPWPFWSLILWGEYAELFWDDGYLMRRRRIGSLRHFPATHRHRVILLQYGDDGPPIPCWTLVVVGARERRWGFWLPTGWCWWRKHNYELNICEDEPIHLGGGD